MADRPLLRRVAVAVLAWNLVVIGWGAFVRATGSGAGCGAHWPLCDGEVVPRAPSVERLIEWTHRASSGIALLAGVLLLVVAFRERPARHPARRGAVASFLFLLMEAALGAGLVLFELVADDASAARALVMALHLVNTFFLLGALALTLHHAGDGRPVVSASDRATFRWGLAALLLLALAGASGAIAALGDTLFPANTLVGGFREDLSPTAHFLLRLRVLHPALATAAAVAVVLLAARLLGRSEGPTATRRARWAGVLALAQIGVGVVNLALLAPIALQLAHLLLADLIWIATVLALASALAAAGGPPAAAAAPLPGGGGDPDSRRIP